jgi:hypothetical protein
MKPIQSVTFATWMLEHLTSGSHSEALSGDLLEEFQHGRSAGWYWRQVVSAIGIEAFRKSRNYTLPLVFSAGWSVLYPGWWLSITHNPLTQIASAQWLAHDWPYSSALQGVGEIIPAITFVWLGFFVYLMLRTDAEHTPSKLRLFASLSISLNVLVVTTVALWHPLNHFKAHLSYVAGEDFSFNSHLIAISIPLALSLFSAISSAFSRARDRQHGTTSVAGRS